MKRPADNQGANTIPKKPCPAWSKKDHPALPTNIYRKDGSNVFRWQKTINKKIYHEGGFKTMEEAEKALAVFLIKLYA